MAQRTVDQSISLEMLGAPTIPCVLSDIDGGEVNLLLREIALNDLRVEFPMWSDSKPSTDSPEVLVMKLDNSEVQSRRWTAEVQQEELFVMIPKGLLTEGVHTLNYHVTLGNGNSNDSLSTVFTVDKTEPDPDINPAALVFPAQVNRDGVTRQYLEGNDDQLIATVPEYFEPKPGDKIIYYWDVGTTGSPPVGERTLTRDDIDLDDLTICFEGQMLRDKGNGDAVATYEVHDRAGNESRMSRSAGVKVNIIDAPSNLPMPSVKKAVPVSSSVGELCAMLVTDGAEVVVPEDGPTQASDKVVVYWQGVVPSASHVADTPIIPGGLEYAIPASAVPGNIGKDRTVCVYYTVQPQGEAAVESLKYPLTIVAVPKDNYPKPQCTQAAGSPGQLKLSSVPDGADFHLAPWVFVSAGQTLNAWIEGVDTSGEDLYEEIVKAQPVTAANVVSGVDFKLELSVLRKLQVNEVFWVTVEVSFDEGKSYIAFPRQELNLVA